MLRRSRLPFTTSAMGALVLSLGLAVQPASAGGHHGKSRGQYVALPAGSQFAAGGSQGLVPVSLPGTAGFYTPAVASYNFAPAATIGYSQYAPAATYFAGYQPAAAFGTAEFAGFMLSESAAIAAYNGSPELAYRLGGKFPLLHRKLTTHAQVLKTNGVKGSKLRDVLKGVALPLIGEILGFAVPGSGPIFNEVMNVLGGIADEVDPTATTPAAGGDLATSGGGTVINVFLETKDGKLTAKAVVGDGTGKVSVKPAHEGGVEPNNKAGTVPPVIPVDPAGVPKLAANDQPALDTIRTTITQVASDMKSLKADVAQSQAATADLAAKVARAKAVATKDAADQTAADDADKAATAARAKADAAVKAAAQ